MHLKTDTLFMQRETMRYTLNNLAFGERFQSLKADYSARYTSELAQKPFEKLEIDSKLEG